MTVEDDGDFEQMTPSRKDSEPMHGDAERRRRRMELARTMEAPSPPSAKAGEATFDVPSSAGRGKVNPLARTVPLAQIAPHVADPPVGEGAEDEAHSKPAAPKRND